MRKQDNNFQYVSNSGIVFTLGEKKLGIDCLCKDTTKLYQDTPLQIREELKLDVLIFTHEHEDHFYKGYVKEAWEKNPDLQIYATKKVIELLAQNNIPIGNLHSVRGGDTLEVDFVQIQFLQSVHEGPQYVDVQNLTLLIRMGEQYLVITGDAAPTTQLFQNIASWSKKVDWLFVPFPYIGLRSTRKLLCENLNIQNIFVLHQPRKEADTQGWVANAKKVCEQAKDSLPMPIFPDKLGEWYRI